MRILHSNLESGSKNQEWTIKFVEIESQEMKSRHLMNLLLGIWIRRIAGHFKNEIKSETKKEITKSERNSTIRQKHLLELIIWKRLTFDFWLAANISRAFMIHSRHSIRWKFWNSKKSRTNSKLIIHWMRPEKPDQIL